MSYRSRFSPEVVTGPISPPGFTVADLLSENTCRAPLESLDLRTLVYLSGLNGGAPVVVESDLAALGRAVYGRPPGGSDRRALHRSLERLAGAIAILDGCDLTAGLFDSARTRAPLFRAIAEGPRGSVRFEFSPWLAAALARGGFRRLELRVMRALSPTSQSLLACLETKEGGVLGRDGVERLSLAVDPDLYARLALRYGRATDARRHVLAAADLVVRVHPRYVSAAIRRRCARWLLCVERVALVLDQPPDASGP